jgi:5-methylcytosine-specific restriction enzyme A
MRKLRTLTPTRTLKPLERTGPAAGLTPARLRGRRLQERNARLVQRSPLCVACLAIGRIRAATESDHRTPLHLGGEDSESNIDRLCRAHHAAKTAAEAAARSRGY